MRTTLTWARLQLKCDGTRWRMEGEVKGKLENGVGNQYPSHYLGTWCMQHYYRWCAHLELPVVDWNDAPRWFTWTRPFRWKTKSGFYACAITFQLASTTYASSFLSPSQRQSLNARGVMCRGKKVSLTANTAFRGSLVSILGYGYLNRKRPMRVK